jgi:hypothetical protein
MAKVEMDSDEYKKFLLDNSTAAFLFKDEIAYLL